MCHLAAVSSLRPRLFSMGKKIHIFTNPAAQNESGRGLNLAHWLAYLMVPHEQKKATEKVVVLHIPISHNYITNKQKKIRYFGFQRGPPP